MLPLAVSFFVDQLFLKQRAEQHGECAQVDDDAGDQVGISLGKYLVGRYAPPTLIWLMNSEEKMVPMGFEFASSAVAMPLKPIAGRLVEFRGFHSPPPDR